jgi:hypothetical protein
VATPSYFIIVQVSSNLREILLPSHAWFSGLKFLISNSPYSFQSTRSYGSMGSFRENHDDVPGDAHRNNDESTPLLGQQYERNEYSTLSRSSTILLAAQNGNLAYLSEDEVDEEELDLELAKTMSVPHSIGIEPLPPLVNQRRSRHPSFAAEPDEDGRIHRVLSTGSIGESKFIGVSRGRFWAIFSGILFGYFVAMFDSNTAREIVYY